jgi:hypothetical protein
MLVSATEFDAREDSAPPPSPVARLGRNRWILLQVSTFPSLFSMVASYLPLYPEFDAPRFRTVLGARERSGVAI